MTSTLPEDLTESVENISSSEETENTNITEKTVTPEEKGKKNKKNKKENRKKDTNKSTSLPVYSEPSRIMKGEYAILMETNDKECESWYTFIRKEGNEKNLKHLQTQLDEIDDWHVMEDMSIFAIELDPWVSAKTAKEMTKIDMNSYSFHRKFDGKLEKIDFSYSKKDSDETKMCKVFDQIGYGQIEDYLEDEDLDPEDLADSDNDESDNDEGDESDDDESDLSLPELDKKKKPEKKKKIVGLPPALLKSDAPKWARAKQRKNRKKPE